MFMSLIWLILSFWYMFGVAPDTMNNEMLAGLICIAISVVYMRTRKMNDD